MADKKAPVAKKTTTKKANEVKTLEQLQEDLVKAHADHLESRKSHRQGELVNPHILTIQRKSIARLMTKINQANNLVKEAN